MHPSDDRTAPRIRGVSPEVQQAAQELRRNLTPAEKKLWAALHRRQVNDLRWRVQHPVGPFILDFYCASRKLVVELDGSSHDDEEANDHDEARTEQLTAYGYRVLRFRNAEVFADLASVLVRIAEAAANAQRPEPPRIGGQGG